jgi:hypothetical protein
MKVLRAMTIAVRRMVAVCLLLFPVTASAQSDEPPPFASYEAFCDYQIVYWPTIHMALGHVTPDGRRIIVLDPILQRANEMPRRVFLAAHECAHHRFGDTRPEGIAKRIADASVVTDQELKADCWAAETLARAGDFAVVEAMAAQFYRDGAASPGGGYPSGVQRALTLKRCGETGLARRGKARQVARNGAILSIFD